MDKSIAIFTAFYPFHLGGVERYTQCLSNALVSLGYSVDIVTSDTRHYPLDMEGEARVLALPSIGLMDDRFPLLRPFSIRKVLSRMQSNYAGVIIQTRYYPVSLLGLSFANKHGIPALLIDHSTGHLASGSGLVDKCIRAYERAVTYVGKRYNPEYYSVSNRGIEWLHQFCINSNGTIPNSIDVDEYIALSSGRDWVHEIGLNENDFVVVFAGRLLKEKGVLKLAEAVSALSVKYNSIHLLIAGDGPEKESLMNCGELRHVHVLGGLSATDMSALFSQAGLLCFPSDYPEGLPTVLLEAGAHGVPIVVSNTGGTDELVPSEDYGIVLEDTRKETIMKAIEAMYLDRSRSKRMGLNLSQRIRGSFSWDSTASKVVRIFEDAVYSV